MKFVETDLGASAHLIMRAARRLFVQRGVEDVTVREIAEAAGQKNHGAVSYYFGSKDGLVRRLVAEDAKTIDVRRNAMLDELEASGGPLKIREIVAAIIYPSIALESDARHENYTRFIVTLVRDDRDRFLEALEDRWNSGYQRCLDHLRHLMPSMSSIRKNQRFLFMGALLGSALAAREQALEATGQGHPMWDTDDALEHLIDAVTALLEAP